MAKITLKYIVGKRYDGMMGRCYREKDRSYERYGAKGVRVCSEWLKNIDSFRDWFIAEIIKVGISHNFFMDNRKYYQLDRIDSTGHYTPENCTIVRVQENQRNTSRRKKRVYISAEGEKLRL